MLKIKGDILEKMICLTGLNRDDLGKKIGTSRQSMLTYIKSGEIDEVVLGNLEKLLGFTVSDLETFLQNGKSKSQGQSITEIEKELRHIRDELEKVNYELLTVYREKAILERKLKDTGTDKP